MMFDIYRIINHIMYEEELLVRNIHYLALKTEPQLYLAIYNNRVTEPKENIREVVHELERILGAEQILKANNKPRKPILMRDKDKRSLNKEETEELRLQLQILEVIGG